MKGFNHPSNPTNLAQKFKYNGKEFEESLGYNMYEMDVRSYDPAIARWTSIDPVTHHSMSTYTAFDNNPIFYADPGGADSRNWRDITGSTNAGFTNAGDGPANFGKSDAAILDQEQEKKLGEKKAAYSQESYLPEKVDLSKSRFEIIKQLTAWFYFIDKLTPERDATFYLDDIIDYSSLKKKNENKKKKKMNGWQRFWKTISDSMVGEDYSSIKGQRRLQYDDEEGSVIITLQEGLLNDFNKNKPSLSASYVGSEEQTYQKSITPANDSEKGFWYYIYTKKGGKMITYKITGYKLYKRINNAVQSGLPLQKPPRTFKD